MIPMGRTRRRSFGKDASGIAALEFALIVPVLLVLYMGASDAAMAVSLNRKLEGTASTVGDLVGQEQTVTKDQLKLILAIARALIQPFDSKKLSTVVTSVTIDANGISKVDWSFASGGAVADAKGTAFKLPASFATHRSRSLVVTKTSYTYEPLGGYGFPMAIPMGSSAYLTPRNTTAAIRCSDC